MPRYRFLHMNLLKAASKPGGEESAGPETEESDLGPDTETPLLDIYEEPEAIVIEADLPGINPDEVSVLLSQNQVVIEGRRGEGHEDGNYLRMERCNEDFRRIIPLPIAVDPRQAEARYRQGVLILRFPRIEDRRKRAIKIQIR